MSHFPFYIYSYLHVLFKFAYKVTVPPRGHMVEQTIDGEKLF